MDEHSSQIAKDIASNIDEKQYQLAINKAKNYLEDQPSNEIEVLLVQSLFSLKQYVEARKEVMENPNAFTTNEQDFLLMINVLLKNNEYIKSREIVETFKANDSYYNDGIKLIEESEASFRSNSSEEIHQLAQKFYHISSKQTMYWQKESFLNGQHLPFDEFLKYSRFVLMDPFVQSVIKAEVIDTLRKVGSNEVVDMMWIDGKTKKVKMGEIKSLQDMNSYQLIFNRLTDEYMMDPEKFMLLSSYFQHQSILMYPFNDEIILDANRWYDLSIQAYLSAKEYTEDDNDDYVKLIEIIKRQFNSIK
ncbi:hypothetical protein AKUA1202_09700 [Apilactobacillus kunkeei]|nr:hypothetical protein [Apilactobacillus kunkeei]TPR49296.1 hypothetical protein DY042_06585 [Apilactobacillus kunkeei]CAI2613358.1 hypothetical protein AKUA1401_08880 [Apilactobacillus kunkeei]CAI2620742.1 hypothetical protein AKUH3B209X_09440 [Apilactobacillus kunkeei]CAI2683803.1 hypothetical protein AKUH4B505J_09080 [Apilactobacillus kunkeei]CAI2685450.1 hypothetical protein AKUA1202_09700 [Apilactobacillus kunkeei]